MNSSEMSCVVLVRVFWIGNGTVFISVRVNFKMYLRLDLEVFEL